MNTEKSEKLPAMMFFPGDWRKHPGIQALTYHDRGVWHEILLLMFESDQRGRLLLNGKPMPDEALARLLGLDKQVLVKTITTLIDYGVANRDSDGALYCDWMVEQERLRKIRKEAGRLGGNPQLIQGKRGLLNQNPTKPKNEVKQNPTLSGSVSDSSSKEENQPPARAREPSDNVKKLVADEKRQIEVQEALNWVKEQKEVTELFYEKDWIHLFTLLSREGIDLEEFRKFYTWVDEQSFVDFVEPPIMRQQIEAYKKRDKIKAKRLKPKEDKKGGGNNNGSAAAGGGNGKARVSQSDDAKVR
jgi:hypothetical protein